LGANPVNQFSFAGTSAQSLHDNHVDLNLGPNASYTHHGSVPVHQGHDFVSKPSNLKGSSLDSNRSTTSEGSDSSYRRHQSIKLQANKRKLSQSGNQAPRQHHKTAKASKGADGTKGPLMVESLRTHLDKNLSEVLDKLERDKLSAASVQPEAGLQTDHVDVAVGSSVDDGQRGCSTEAEAVTYFIAIMQAYNRGSLLELQQTIDRSCASNCYLR
jgi:hypothetical protein